MKQILVFLVLAVLIVCPASAIIMSCTGVGSCTMNQTFNLTPNMTANFTAGPPGATGPAGSNGANGADGAPGTAATVAVNYTFTLPNSSPATVVNIGDSTTARFDFGIPVGITGAIGATGPMNQTFNLTQNMTINLTANMTMNMTANMTMNQTVLDLSWNSTYPLLSGLRTLTGKWNFGGFNISNIGDPVVSSDAAARGWVISQINSSPLSVPDQTQFLFINGTRWMSGRLNMSMLNVSNISTIADGDAVNRTYMLSQINSSPSTGSVPDQTQYLFLNGTRAMTGRLNATQNISGITIIVGATDATNKSYVDAVNTSMLNNISSLYSTTTADATQDELINSSMRNNVSQYVIAVNNSQVSLETAVNDSMRNNVSQYVLAVNLSQVNLETAVNDSMRNNVSQYVLAVNQTVLNNLTGYPLLTGVRAFTGTLNVSTNISGIKTVIGLTDATNKSYAGTHGAATSITNGGTITHGCGATPVGCQVQPTVANTTMQVTAMSSTTFTVGSWRMNATWSAGGAGATGISQTVYWECFCV
jgi:hypothetical protein